MHYAVERCVSGTNLTDDSGMAIRDGAKTISKYGVVQESNWPYNTTNSTVFPPLSAFQKSKIFKTFVYTFVSQDTASLKSCLIAHKAPIIFGFTVYSSFMAASNGIIPVPDTTTETLEGGHCTCIIGFDDSNQWFICANSWGTDWGDKGYFYMPYAYINDPNLASDFCYLAFTGF